MKFIQKYKVLILLLGISLLPVVSLFYPGVPMAHDWPDHVARIANFYASLSDGNVVPRWAGNLNWGYGHPILMFLYPFSSYLASAFHFTGFSFIDSTKLVFGLTYVGSVVAMYLWLLQAFGKRAAFAGALLYGFAPYRFVDLHVRGALGEHAAFLFPPLIFYFMHQLSLKKEPNIIGITGLSVSTGLLILAHNAIAIMFLPLIVMYGIYLWFSNPKTRPMFTVSLLLSLVLGFGLSAFFWIPAFFEGKYTLRDIVTAGEALQRFVPWTMFFYSPWNYGGGDQLTKFLGIAHWTGIAISLWILLTKKKTMYRNLLLASLLLLICSLFIMTSQSSYIWKSVTLLQKFQFPWRFMSVVTFLTAVIGGLSIDYFKNKKLLIIFCLMIIISTSGMWHPKGYTSVHESTFTGVYLSTTDTGESSPIWSVRFMEHTPARPSEVISGDAQITEGERTSTRHMYTIDVQSPSRILENTLYFPGWMVYVDGVSTGLQWQDPDYRGLITYRLTEGKHSILVQFEDTKIRKWSQYVSVITVIILILITSTLLLWKRKK